MTIDYPNAHTINPFYRPTDQPAFEFAAAVQEQYDALNSRRAAAYETELVPLSQLTT